MSAAVAAFILATAFATSVLSGVFGMAGGLVLMGALALVLPVSAALVTHGLIQMVANGWRAILHRQHLQWRIVGLYALGSAAASSPGPRRHRPETPLPFQEREGNSASCAACVR